ncbi:hypothetical protein MLD38_040284 [Melastoma candidum]|uniref:Uncharacterized protein n=1 Tax=Melastoma candidum TaxID=119954 RepID=A0ACB9L4W6_9MYRT|nr:hypothetical protein MLD38_040284 [Melastoma candidum]
MEPLYAKLYDKYAGLKAKRFNELDAAQKDQEVKFATCIAAAEELIQHLRKENDELRDRVNEFTASNQSFEVVPSVDYQKLLAEEIEKNRKLSEEVERLQRLQQGGASSNRDCGDSDSGKVSTPGARDGTTHGTTGRSGKKRRRSSSSDMGGKVDTTVSRLEKDPHQEVASLDAREENEQPDCRVRAKDIGGELLGEHSATECLFRVLLQHTLGLSFSIAQGGGICITILHETTGYSFTLTFLRSDGGVELMYKMMSLGTLERIAPEWMREVIKFSISMFPMFFQRITDVTKSPGTYR